MIKDLVKDDLPNNLLKGKTIVISGAGSGIGRQASKTFADHGANLILLSKDQKKLESLYDEIKQDDSRNVIIQPFNFEGSSEKDYQEIVYAIKEEYPILDGLLNNAAVLGEKKPLEQYSYESWKNVLQVNLDASFLLTKSLLPLLKNQTIVRLSLLLRVLEEKEEHIGEHIQ